MARDFCLSDRETPNYGRPPRGLLAPWPMVTKGAVTVFVPEIAGAPTFENFAENGRVSVTIADAPTHETYQFKGQLSEIRPCSEADYTVQEIYISKLNSYLEPFGYGNWIWNGFVVKPAKAVTFAVEDIFVQTPGPGAGEKIDLNP